MSDLLQLTMERVQDNMDDILTNFKAGAKITVLVRTPGKPTADFCLTSDTLDEVAAMIERRKEETPPPQTNLVGPQDISTAPKMTDVLVWWPIVKLDDDGEPTEEIVDGRWIISEDQGGYWIEPDVMNAIGDHLGDDFTYAAQPSHWMPLPAPLFVPVEDQP